MQKAAALKDAGAAFALANFYDLGVGVAKDPALALSWYQKSADMGSREAQHNLAIMFPNRQRRMGLVARATCCPGRPGWAGRHEARHYRHASLPARCARPGNEVARTTRTFSSVFLQLPRYGVAR